MASLQSLPVTETGISYTQDQKTFTHIITTLLAQESYSPELQQQYTAFWTTHILPYLNEKTAPNWTSTLTYNDSPCEPSRNAWNGQTSVRFGIEPLSPVSGTSFDPYNQLASVGLVEKLGRLDVFPGYDRELWDFFTKELWVWRKEDVEKALAIPAIRKIRSCLIAVDMRKSKMEMVLKGYCNVFHKAHILKKSPAVVMFDTIKKLPERKDEKIALKKLEEFVLNGRDAGHDGLHNMAKQTVAEVNGLVLTMISWDFLDRFKSRIKMYARCYDLRWSSCKENYTLGGRIPRSDKEMQILQTFYAALFNLPENWDGVTEHVERQDDRKAGVFYQYELVHGQQLPIVKLYIAFWHVVVPNDAESARRLQRFFRTQSWGQADTYLTQMEELFGPEKVEKEVGRHTFISFAYTEEHGPYVTMYYAPKLEKQQ